jgi:uncharacterized membrane protein
MNAVATSVEADRTFTLASYVLHLIGAVVGITSIIGLILNYLKRGTSGEALDSHHTWMIRSFWWAILWSVIGFITLVIGIGVAILVITWIWYIYRHVRGLIALANGEPMPL